MAKRYVLSFDQGTTSSRAILFDSDGAAAASAQYEFPQFFPHSGWVEQDARDIWATTRRAALDTLEKAGVRGEDIAAIGITNQRETTIIWDRRTGEPVYNAIVWQCRRTADICRRMTQDGMADYVNDTTGLIIDPYFSATKIKWVLDNVEGVRERANRGELLFGTVDCWLLWKLTDGAVHASDVTNAARTMLFDINRMCWDRELLSYFGIPECMMPEVCRSSGIVGIAGSSIEPLRGVPVGGMAGDQQASLFGQACFDEGDTKNTYGTGCFMLMNTGMSRVKSKNSLLTTVAWDIGDGPRYALEGSIFNAGTVVKWMRDDLGLIASAAETEKIALSVDDTAGVYLVPAFTGLGAPYWDADARGIMAGLTRATKRAHIVRAGLESMAYQTRDLIAAMEADSGVELSTLKVDGGASVNNFLMQFQSDMLGRRVDRPKNVETTALGAAYLAGLAAGVWSGLGQIAKIREADRIFEPSMTVAHREKLYIGWKNAVERSLKWSR